MTIPDDGIPGWERGELARAIHSCDSRALIAFYSHFRPLLTERAISFGIPVSERADAVETFLGDMLMSMAAGEQLPSHLHGYVLISFRRFAARRGKAQQVEDQALAEYQLAFLESSARRVSELEPVYDLRPGRLEVEGQRPAHSGLLTFCEMLLAELDAEDRFLLGAKAEEMPLREIAALLGVNYNAANTRLCRLRSKLRLKAADVVRRLDESDRLVVERFLRRARRSESGGSNITTREREGDSRRLSNG